MFRKRVAGVIASAVMAIGLLSPVANAQPERIVAPEERDDYVAEFYVDPAKPPVIDGVRGFTEAEIDEYRDKARQAEASGPPQSEITPGQMWSDKVGLPEGADKAEADQTEVAIAREQSQPQTMSLRATSTRCQTYWLAPQVCGAILDRYEQQGGVTSWLGFPMEPMSPNPDGQGQRQRFMGGFIYWHPETGAHAVSNLTAPVWERNGWEAGWLGYPLGGEVPVEGSSTIDGEINGWVQLFQGGRIYRSPVLKGFQIASINGLILDKWLELGGPNSDLGFPIADEAKTADGVGRFSTFQNGIIYWHPNYGAHSVQEPVLSEWARTGYESGEYGYPLSDAVVEGEYLSQQFENGEVETQAPNPLMMLEEVPFIKFDTPEEAWTFFDRVEQGLEELPSSSAPLSLNQSESTSNLETLQQRNSRKRGCLLTVPNPHIRTSVRESQKLDTIGIKPETYCTGEPERIQHQTYLVHGIGSINLGHVPNINGEVDEPVKDRKVPKRWSDQYDTRYVSKDLLQLCEGTNKRWYRGNAKAWVTIDGDNYYARAYSRMITKDCSVKDSIL